MNLELFKPTSQLRDEDDEKIDVIMNGAVREALNISRPWGTQSGKVFSYLAGDFMKPVTHVGKYVYVFNINRIHILCFSWTIAQRNVAHSGGIQWPIGFDCRYARYDI